MISFFMKLINYFYFSVIISNICANGKMEGHEFN